MALALKEATTAAEAAAVPKEATMVAEARAAAAKGEAIPAAAGLMVEAPVVEAPVADLAVALEAARLLVGLATLPAASVVVEAAVAGRAAALEAVHLMVGLASVRPHLLGTLAMAEDPRRRHWLLRLQATARARRADLPCVEPRVLQLHALPCAPHRTLLVRCAVPLLVEMLPADAPVHHQPAVERSQPLVDAPLRHPTLGGRFRHAAVPLAW